MNNYNDNLIKWACEEVDRQGESALSVPAFLQGWDFAHTTPYPMQQTISILNEIVNGWPDGEGDLVKRFGRLYRATPVTFVNGNTGAKADQIPRLMDQLCDSDLWDDDREAFVLEFLKIHPFEDGNGRVAAILMNLAPRLRDFPQDPNKQTEFVPVPSMDGWGYGSAVEVVDFEDDKPSRERPVLKMRDEGCVVIPADVTEIST
jgi:hypothetical protein|tara:strand:- start:9312 stop:9923 length:612 start_codon:yes stop_codon:yes gene_type:complete